MGTQTIEQEGVQNFLKDFSPHCPQPIPFLGYDAKQDTPNQITHGDYSVTLPDFSNRYIDVKAEWTHTGNLFIETWSNRSIGRKGWYNHLSQCDLLYYYFCQNKTAYCLRWKLFHAWLEEEITVEEETFDWQKNDFVKTTKIFKRIDRYREVKQKKNEQTNDAYGRLVPIADIPSHILAKTISHVN